MDDVIHISFISSLSTVKKLIETHGIYRPAMTLGESIKQSSGVSTGSSTGGIYNPASETVAWLSFISSLSTIKKLMMGFAIKTLGIYNPAMTLSESAKQSSGVSIASSTGRSRNFRNFALQNCCM